MGKIQSNVELFLGKIDPAVKGGYDIGKSARDKKQGKDTPRCQNFCSHEAPASLMGTSHKNKLLIFTADFNLASFLETTDKELFRHRVFEKPLDRPFERSGPVNRIETFFDEKLKGIFGQFHLDLPVL